MKNIQLNFAIGYQMKIWNAGGCVLGYKFRIGSDITEWSTLLSGQTVVSKKFFPDRISDYPVAIFVDAHGCGETHCFAPNPLKPVNF